MKKVIYLSLLIIFLGLSLSIVQEKALGEECPIKTIGLSRDNFNDLKSDPNIINEVKSLQTILSKIPNIGWQPSYRVTGVFGSGTEGVLRRFQKAYDLNNTGIIDEATKEKLCQLWEYQNRQITTGGAGGITGGGGTTGGAARGTGGEGVPAGEISGYKYKTCYIKVWSRDPAYCGPKPYCCVPWHTEVKENEPCPGNQCESDSDPSGKYLSDPKFWEKRDQGIYKACYQKKCNSEEKCTPSFVGYVDTSKNEKCPSDSCSSDLQCKSNNISSETKKCVYNQCLMSATNQYPSDTGLVGICQQVTEYVPKNQSCPGSGCKEAGYSCGYNSISGFWYGIASGVLNEPMCQVKKCFNSGTSYARCEVKNVPATVTKTYGNYYTLKCESNECETAADCGGEVGSLTSKECTYKTCEGTVCKSVTIRVGIRDVCPKDQCINDQECKDIVDGKSKACDYNVCWITAGSATCTTKRIKVAANVDCNSRYPNECSNDKDCESKKRPPCETNFCSSDQKCLRSYYDNCPFETVPPPECRLGHNEDCANPINKNTSYRFSCVEEWGCFYDPVEGSKYNNIYTNLEDCKKACGGKVYKDTAWVCDYAVGKCKPIPANTAYLYFRGFGEWSDGDGAEYWCNKKCYVKDEYKIQPTDVKTCQWTVCDSNHIPPLCVAYKNTSYPKDKDCPADDKCTPGATCSPPTAKKIECNYLACENGTCKRKITEVYAVYSGDPPKYCPQDHPDCGLGSGAKCSTDKNPNKCGCLGNVAICTPSGDGKSCNSSSDCPPCVTEKTKECSVRKYDSANKVCYVVKVTVKENESCPSHDPECSGCIPDCTGKECGPDGCGGSCGNCSGGEICINGKCIISNDTKECSVRKYNSSNKTCSVVKIRVPLSESCPADDPECGGGCIPNCTGKECGPDGCGGSCGNCLGNTTCSNNKCVSLWGYAANLTTCKCVQGGTMDLPACEYELEIQGCGGDSCPSGQKKPHNVCYGSSCISVMSCGIDECQNSAACSTTPGGCPSGQKKPHNVCQGSKCKSVDSCGYDQCITDEECAPTTTSTIGSQTKSCSVKYCAGNACNNKIVQVGINESCPPNECEVNYDCYQQQPDPCAGAECGICAGKDYGSCPPGYKCVSGYKCVDVCEGYECGSRDGKNCGTCPSGYKCENYRCVKEQEMCNCKFCNPATQHCVYGTKPCPCPPSCNTDEDCKTSSIYLLPLAIIYSKFQAFLAKLIK